MNSHAPGLRRLDGIIWALIAAVAGIELMAVVFGSFTLMWRSYAAPAGASLLLMLAARYYSVRRNDPNLASALGSTAQLMSFAAVGAPLSYVAASVALPLNDAAFGAMDHVLGFNWRALLALMQAWPALHLVMRAIYLSLTLQMTAVVLLLGFTGRLVWLRVYMLAFIFAALITIAISAALPAEGVWLHYGLHSSDPALVPVSSSSWPAFLGLRDGTFRELMAVGAEGIITFPSLHAALAVIMIAAFWPVAPARWIALPLNVLMLAATPIDGSHYLIDVLAGIAVACVSLAAANGVAGRIAERTRQPSPGTADIGLVPGN
jgi:hypothetical protein